MRRSSVCRADRRRERPPDAGPQGRAWDDQGRVHPLSAMPAARAAHAIAAVDRWRSVRTEVIEGLFSVSTGPEPWSFHTETDRQRHLREVLEIAQFGDSVAGDQTKEDLRCRERPPIDPLIQEGIDETEYAVKENCPKSWRDDAAEQDGMLWPQRQKRRRAGRRADR